MIKVSIIVPFYNVEPYIEQCIRSLYDQDVSVYDYEVICVDDCSPDGSRAIVKRLQKEYPSLQLLSHEYNKRQGGARNTGLRAAKGKYVWFVDSDDYVQTNCLRQLFKIINDCNDADVYHFDYLIDSKDCGDVKYDCFNHTHKDGKIFSGVDFVLDVKDRWFQCVDVAWRALYKRDFLLSNSLFFAENVMYEDTDWSLRLFMFAKTVIHYSISPYVYRVNSSSITGIPDNPQKLAWKMYLLVRSCVVEKLAYSEEYKFLINKFITDESYVIGKKLQSLSVLYKFKYISLIEQYDLSAILKHCSYRNGLRLRLAV